MPSYKDVYKRPPITSRDWIFPFGKHKGVNLSVVMDADPQYIEWCIEREMIELGHALLDEFEQMNPWMHEDNRRRDAAFEAFVETHVLAD